MRARSLAKDLGGIPKKKKSLWKQVGTWTVGGSAKDIDTVKSLSLADGARLGILKESIAVLLYRAEDTQRDSQNQTIGS